MAYRIEQNSTGQGEIVFDGWERGVADDPFTGPAQLTDVEINEVQGLASVNYKLQQQQTQTNSTFTANAGTDVITYTAPTMFTNTAVVLTTTGTLPAGLSLNTTYYVIWVSSTTAKLATSYLNSDAGTQIDITDAGTGTHTITTINITRVTASTYGYFKTVSGGSPVFTAFLGDDSGRVWRSDFSNPYVQNKAVWIYVNNTVVATYIGGLAMLNNWLIIFQGVNVNTYKYDGTYAANWQTTNTGNKHFALTGQDAAIYFCNGAQIGSIIATTSAATFDPTNAATYTFNTSALALPPEESANCLAELGTNLMVGGSSNRIYPWDRLSTSYSFPIFLAENVTTHLVTANTTMYIFCGVRGRIYQSNGSNANLFFKIPDHIFQTTVSQPKLIRPQIQWKSAIYHKNKLLFSIYVTGNDQSLSTAIGAVATGVYQVELENKSFSRQNTFSFGTATTQYGMATALIPINAVYDPSTDFNNYVTCGDAYCAAWQRYTGSATSYGVDGFWITVQSNNASPTQYSGGESVVDTEMIRIGGLLTRRTFEKVEWLTAQPIITGETVQILARNSLSASFVSIGTTTGTASNLSDVYDVNFENYQWIQLRAVLTGSTSASASGIRLKEIRIR